MNVYQKILKRDGKIYALAPMEGVTDSVFRQILCDIGKPDLFFTEFMNTDGYMSKGRDKVSDRLRFVERERPIVFQLWGNTPENYAAAVKDIKRFKPDGVDINIGCSVRNVLSSGHCSSLIKDPELVKRIIDAVKSEAGNIPVSVKTRIGYDSIITNEWFSFLLEQNLDLITVHGRISKQGYDEPANWEEVSKVVKLRDALSPSTVILGNGDVDGLDMADSFMLEYGVDGVMLGRAVMQNPWLFSRRLIIGKKERLSALEEHLELFKSTWGGDRPFNTQKKYIKMYLNGFDGANELRIKLMKCDNLDEVLGIIKTLLS
ncbi:MAG: tRNA-dihydrouridine synthase [Candidatus Dojkabacteria bacterium]|jgi:tRNA-dihydrouridine synthase|nr:tRNA-dihydrouridine synthase [Candidatus Dojkabacteria bacterium]MDD2269967.1 tRNA-dihydrouridine synthase [Candidatus Dojkabacteria bacterium]